MSDDQLEDLKQYMDSRFTAIDRRFNDIDSRFDSVDSHLVELREEMRDGFAGVGEAIEGVNDRLDSYQKSSERRLAILERKAV